MSLTLNLYSIIPGLLTAILSGTVCCRRELIKKMSEIDFVTFLDI